MTSCVTAVYLNVVFWAFEAGLICGLHAWLCAVLEHAMGLLPASRAPVAIQLRALILSVIYGWCFLDG